MKHFFTAILFLIYSWHGYSQIPTAGLLAYYPFSGNSNDATVNGYHPIVVNNVTLTADVCGNMNSAYLFNGSNSYIELPSTPFIGLNKFSYCFWIKAAPQATIGHGVPFSVGESSFGYGQAVTLNAANFLFAGSYNSGSTPLQSYVTSTTLSFNHWHYVVMTRDSVDVRMYVDGVQTATVINQYTNGQTASYGSNLPIRATIGCRPTNTYYFNGAIDEVRVYNRVLSASEVYALSKSCCALTISPSSSITICEGNSANLQVTGAANFVWSNSVSGSSISVSPLQNSVFTASNVAQDCPTSTNCTVNVSKCTAVNSIQDLSHPWQPNPTSGSVERMMFEQNRITLYDFTGKVIFVDEVEITGIYKLDLIEHGLKSGIYYIVIMNKGKSEYQRLILQY